MIVSLLVCRFRAVDPESYIDDRVESVESRMKPKSEARR